MGSGVSNILLIQQLRPKKATSKCRIFQGIPGCRIAPINMDAAVDLCHQRASNHSQELDGFRLPRWIPGVSGPQIIKAHPSYFSNATPCFL